MTQNPYESKKAKRNRIVSNIVIVFFIVTFVWGLYHVFIGSRSKIVPFEFTEITAQVVEDNRNDEFDELFNYVLTLDEDTVKDDSFAKKFPVASALLDMEKGIYSDKLPYFCIDSGRLVLAQTVLSETADCRELEVMMSNLSTAVDGNTATVSMSDCTVYTLVYNARSGVMSYKKYEQSQFHMNLFSLSAVADGGRPTECKYDLTLGGNGFDENKCKQLVYDPVNATYGDPEVEVKRTRATITAVQKDSVLTDDTDNACYSIRTANGLFGRIKKLEMSFTFDEGVTPTLTFVANR